VLARSGRRRSRLRLPPARQAEAKEDEVDAPAKRQTASRRFPSTDVIVNPQTAALPNASQDWKGDT
jgi:hypothetical protein